MQKTNGGQTTIYPNNLYEVQGTTTTKHIYANGNLVATVKSDTPASKLYHNHLDHLDSTKAITTPDGYLDQELEYYPFGETKLDNQYGSLTQSNQYIGQNFDQETELSYLNARYYDGTRGQMLTQDPVFLGAGANNKFTMILKDPQLQNSYGYARNNPLIYKDPNGELAFLVPSVVGGVLGAIGGIVTEAISGGDSSFSDYAAAAGQGAIIGAGTGGAATISGFYKLSKLATMGTAGTATGGLTAATQIGGDSLMGRETNTEDVVFKSTIAFATAGTLSKLPKVRGANPNIGTAAFFTGKHTQRQAAEESVHTSAQSLSSSARAYSSGGSSNRSSSNSNRSTYNKYQATSKYLSSAYVDISRGNYKSATKNLNRANNALGK